MLHLIFLITLIMLAGVVWYIMSPTDAMDGDEGEYREGFETHYLSFCPSGYKSSYNVNGDLICCDGEVIGGKCLADRQCTLNGKGTDDAPNCVDLMKREYKEKAAIWCPASLPNYFEDRAKEVKGCTDGSLNTTMTGPKATTQPHCLIYSDFKKNRLMKDSCYNNKELDKAECFGKDCKKELIQVITDAPPLVSISFTDGMGMRRTAYTKQSLTNYFDGAMPDWRSKGMNLDKNIMVAEVAKAVYVDKTMAANQIQL